MALIKCPECNKEVSDKAEICVHCGYPISKWIKEEKSANRFDNFESHTYDFDFGKFMEINAIDRKSVV